MSPSGAKVIPRLFVHVLPGLGGWRALTAGVAVFGAESGAAIGVEDERGHSHATPTAITMIARPAAIRPGRHDGRRVGGAVVAVAGGGGGSGAIFCGSFASADLPGERAMSWAVKPAKAFTKSAALGKVVSGFMQRRRMSLPCSGRFA